MTENGHVIERKNLISLTKLIVKDLIASSLCSGRTIDSYNSDTHLNNYFTLIDRVLKHGLKQNLLSNKLSGLWSALDTLPKFLKESTLISESVRSLTNTKSPDGKIKAWMRLAMMQKKLPEYFNQLIANKDTLLRDIYHDYAFMLNDEAQVFAGLIIGVNVIDCNFFVKDANFDNMDDVIDLSLYLRPVNSGENQPVDIRAYSESELAEQMRYILDQKNYLEEYSKRLESTVTNLGSKTKRLEDQISRLEMEAKVSEARIERLQKPLDSNLDKQNSISSFTGVIKNLIVSSETTRNSVTKASASNNRDSNNQIIEECSSQSHLSDNSRSDVSDEKTDGIANPDRSDAEKCLKETSCDTDPIVESPNLTQLNQSIEESSIDLPSSLNSQALERESELITLRERASILEENYKEALRRIKSLERELEIQTSMNIDKETTIKIYEKDLREKQATIESIGESLKDSKELNSRLTQKYNDVSAKLKDRIKTISSLQVSLDKWKIENKNLASQLQEKQEALKARHDELSSTLDNLNEIRNHNEKINNELHEARQTGQDSSLAMETQNKEITELKNQLNLLSDELKLIRPFKDQAHKLMARCNEYEQSLEEVGARLRESRLEVENLKENSAVFLDSQWMDSKQVKACALCQLSFSVTRRKHHCRLCGNVFCQTCSDNKMELASSARPVRVCDTCHAFLLAKFVKSAQ